MNAEIIAVGIQDRAPDELDYAVNEGYYEEIKRDAQKLGLQGQIDLANERLRELRRPKITSPCLSETELLIWREFLPTSYRGTIAKPVRGSRWLSSYRFDLIPTDVRELWVELENSGAFDEFEIRTEEQLSDPALFGIRDGKCWLLARWGETAEALVSLEDIKSLLRQRLTGDRCLEALVAAVSLTAALGLLFFAIFSTRGTSMADRLVCGPITLVLVSAGIAFLARRRQQIKAWSFLTGSKN
jgi:hypothetical protein